MAFASAQILVSSTGAVQLVAAAPYVQEVWINPTGMSPAFYLGGSDVTANNGFQFSASSSSATRVDQMLLPIRVGAGESLYAVSGGDSVGVHVLAHPATSV